MTYVQGTPAFDLPRPQQANTVGTVPSSGITVEEIGGNGVARQTKFILTNAQITTTYTSSSNSSGSVQLYDWPKGAILLKGATCKLAYTTSGTPTPGGSTVFAVGSVAADAGATLSSTEVDIIPSTASTMTSGAGTVTGKSTAAPSALDGTGTAKDAYLNFATSGDMGASRVITVTGWIIINWEQLGDNTIA